MWKMKYGSLIIGLLLLLVSLLPVTAQRTLSDFIFSGIDLYDAGNYQAALAEFDDALTAYPNDSYSYNWRGFIHYLLGDMDAAWADMNRAIEEGEYFAWIDRAMLYTYQGDTVRAIVDYERGMQRYGHYAYPATTYAASPNAFEFFVRTYTPIIEAHPNDFIALTVRGNAYAHLGDYEKALADYDRVLALAPQFDRVRQSRNLVLEQMAVYSLND